MSDTNSRDSFEYLAEEIQDPTLESILAEFKGSAYIAGDKKTSPDLLDERISRIMKESQDGSLTSTELYTIKANEDDFFHDIHTPFGEEVKSEEPIVLTEEDRKVAAKTAQIDWEPVKGVTSLEEVRREAAAFFAKRDEAIIRREEEMLIEKQEARKRAEEERRRAEEEEQLRLEEKRRKAELGIFDSEDDNVQLNIDTKLFSSEDISEINESAEFEEEDHETEILFFDNYRFADDSEDDEYAESGDYSEYDEDKPQKTGLFARIFKKKENLFDDESATEQQYEDEYVAEPETEVYVEEPEFDREASILTRIRNTLMLKSRIALILAAVMGAFTILFDKGIDIFGIGSNIAVFTTVMVFMQLVVMALALEIVNRGITSIFKREMGAETLVVFSNIIAVIASCASIADKSGSFGMPYCAVAAFSTAFSLWGEYRQFAAMSLSLKTAVASSSPQVLSSQYIKDLDASLIRKYTSSPEGFYNNLVEMDIADQTYIVFAPFMIIGAIVLSAVATLGGNVRFIYCLSAISAAAASFSAMSSFSVPFSKVSRKLRRSGAAVAGWGGADDIYFADGVRLTDADVFPDGAQVTGPTALENVKPDKILRYAASLMIASNSGLSKGFEDLLNKQGIAMVSVEHFECYEGGYSGIIRGERVVCGSAACMALLGIRIPQSVNSKNAVFTAINDVLAGAFIVTYKPLKTIQTSLLGLLKSNVKLFFAVRDFNITPLMVQQKLQIPVDDIEYLPTTDAYKMTTDAPDSVPHAAAVISRVTPGVYAETVVSAKSMRMVSIINTAISVISSILGMLIVFLLSFKSDGGMISPSNLMEYMLAVEVAVILLSNII